MPFCREGKQTTSIVKDLRSKGANFIKILIVFVHLIVWASMCLSTFILLVVLFDLI